MHGHLFRRRGGFTLVQRAVVFSALLALGPSLPAPSLGGVPQDCMGNPVTLVTGGGGYRSDCYVELGVGGTPLTMSKTAFVCEDGDPACDRDLQCDDACTLDVQVCINQE